MTNQTTQDLEKVAEILAQRRYELHLTDTSGIGGETPTVFEAGTLRILEYITRLLI